MLFCCRLLFVALLLFSSCPGLTADSKITAAPATGSTAIAEATSSLPSFAAILDSMEARFQRIQDYQTTMDVVIDVKGIHIPPMSALVYFKQPDKLYFEARGFALLPRNAVMMTPALLRKMAQQVEVRAKEQMEKRPAYHLIFKPEEKDKNIEVVVDIWIDSERWVVLKVRTESNRFGWMEVVNQYDVVDQQYWLPKQSRVQMEIQKEILQRASHQEFGLQDSKALKSNFLDELFGTGQMYITFRNYKVNKGLADELFRQDKK